ncbi:MAG: hypothetical protein Q7V57_08980 [Actinomycetota bacterium]|nr:hypothetical protein [Actinomycetota bacterium]
MNAHHTLHALHTSANDNASANRDSCGPIDWLGQIKLAIVLSVVAAVAALGLAGRVSETALIVGVIVVASVVAWSRVEPLQPARVPVRRR